MDLVLSDLLKVVGKVVCCQGLLQKQSLMRLIGSLVDISLHRHHLVFLISLWGTLLRHV